MQNFAPFQTEGAFKEPSQNFAEAELNISESQLVGKSRDIAAKAVGMNHETLRQLKAVVNSGNEELIRQMDNGEKSINAAYKEITQQPGKKAINITLYKKPADDAQRLIKKSGKKYCTELGLALLRAAGHEINLN